MCGPLSVKSFFESRYFIIITNDYSQMTWVYFLKKKNEVLKVMKKFKNLVEIKIGHKLKVMKTNCGRKFLSQAFSDFCNGFNIG